MSHEGLYGYAGFNGEPVSNSSFGARLVADLAIGRDPTTDPEPVQLGRHPGTEQFRIENVLRRW